MTMMSSKTYVDLKRFLPIFIPLPSFIVTLLEIAKLEEGGVHFAPVFLGWQKAQFKIKADFMPFWRTTFPTKMKIDIRLEKAKMTPRNPHLSVVRGFSDQENQYL